MADVMVKILMKGAKAIGKNCRNTHYFGPPINSKTSNHIKISGGSSYVCKNVETMFSVRETPWHGLGRIVMDAPASREALELAGLDWQVESRNIYSGTGAMIPGYRCQCPQHG